MPVQPKANATKERTIEDDAKLINALASEQVWLYGLTLAVPRGSRIVNQDIILQRLGLTAEEELAVKVLLSFCVNTLSAHQLTPASLLLHLTGNGLEAERATLLIDIATGYTSSSGGGPPATEFIGPVLERLDRIEQLVQPRK